MFKKATAKDLVVGNVYVAYSAQSKMLSSNGMAGVFVKVEEVVGENVKVFILHKNRSMLIKDVFNHKDKFIYNPTQDFKVKVSQQDVSDAYPKFTEQMVKDNWPNAEFDVSLSDVTLTTKEGFAGIPCLRLSKDDQRKMLRMEWMSPVTIPEWRIPRAERMGKGVVEINLPPKPVSAEEEELIASLGAHLKEFKENERHDRVSSFVIVDKNFKNKETEYSGPCHAALNRTDVPHPKYILSLHSNQSEQKLPKEIVDNYLSYLTNYSMFKDAFLIKDVEWIKANCHIISGDVSGQHVGGACISTRQMWEYPSGIEAWWNLLKEGIPADLAFIFGMGCHKKSKTHWKFGNMGGGHFQFELNNMDDDAIKNAFDHKAPEADKEPYISTKRYSGLCAMWGGGGMSKAVERLRKIGGGGYGSAGVAQDDFFEQAADIIEEWMKEQGL